MCKKAGLEVSTQPANPYHSDTNTDALGLELSPLLGDTHAIPAFLYTPPTTSYSSQSLEPWECLWQFTLLGFGEALE